MQKGQAGQQNSAQPDSKSGQAQLLSPLRDISAPLFISRPRNVQNLLEKEREESREKKTKIWSKSELRIPKPVKRKV